MCDAGSAQARKRPADLSPHGTWGLDPARARREGFAKMGFGGWRGVRAAGSQGRGGFINNPGCFGDQPGRGWLVPGHYREVGATL